MNEILSNSNGKLISMCGVRNMSYVTRQSIGFVCHPLCKSRSWHRTEIYDNVETSCYVETWSANEICKVFVGPSGWGVTVYKLYDLYTSLVFMYNLV